MPSLRSRQAQRKVHDNVFGTRSIPRSIVNGEHTGANPLPCPPQ